MKEVPAEPSDLEITSGRKKPTSRSTSKKTSPVLSFTSPDSKKFAGKRTRKTDEKAASEVSSDGPVKELDDSKTAHNGASAVAQSAAPKQDVEMKSRGTGVSLLQDSPSQEASKSKTKKKKKKKSVKPTKVGKTPESGLTRPKVESSDDLHVRRLASKGPLMEPRNHRRTVLRWRRR